MLDWRRLEARYRRLTWEQRLGNLSSTLARAATSANNSRTAASVSDLLREAMWVIEWSQADVPGDILGELAAMQHELGLLRGAWEQDQAVIRPLVTYRSRQLSDRAIELSGLLAGHAATG